MTRPRRNRITNRAPTLRADTIYRINRLIILAAHPTCAYCLKRKSATADHIIPRSKGGGNHIANLAATCQPCNTNKGRRTLLEWINTGQAPKGAKTLATQRQKDNLPC